MTGLVTGIGARIVGSLVVSKAKSAAESGLDFLSRVPQRVWEGGAVVGYALALLYTHQHYAHEALKAADQAGYERRGTEDAKALIELQSRERAAEANGKTISQDTRSKNDAQVADTHAAAHAISMRGPSAAAANCGHVGNPAVPAASGQHGAAGDQLPDAARDPVPAANGQSNLATVPFDWLVGRAEQADDDRAEVLTWRDWYARQSAEWAKLKGEGTANGNR